ncbi:MAG TPA: hypothetical protein P5114_04025 [Hyphomicrobiaceae bacterium]|nr:hypothetical protein [Hyphomicrobiaceae bacterium]
MSEKARPNSMAPANQPSALPQRQGVESVPFATTRKPRARARSAIYLASWGALALAASLYLTAATIKPALLSQWLPSIDRALPQFKGDEESRSTNAVQTQQLRSILQNSQAEVSQLRQEISARDARVKSAELRIAGLEKELQSVRATGNGTGSGSVEQLNAATEAQSARTAAATAASNGDATSRALASTIGSPNETVPPDKDANAPPRSFEIVNGTPIVVTAPTGSIASAVPGAEVQVPLPGRRPALAARPKTTPINQIIRPTVAVTSTTAGGLETGSVAGQANLATTAAPANKTTQAVTFGAPVVTRSSNPVAIRLTAGPSIDALRLSWSLMSERYAYELNGLQPRYVAGNASAAPYALIAGPIADEPEARRRCALLIARGIPCSIDSFAGNAL